MKPSTKHEASLNIISSLHERMRKFHSKNFDDIHWDNIGKICKIADKWRAPEEDPAREYFIIYQDDNSIYITPVYSELAIPGKERVQPHQIVIIGFPEEE